MKIKLLILNLFIIKLLFSQTMYFPPLTGSTWETISPSALSWCDDKINNLYTYLETTNTKGFLILKDGKIVLEKYFGTFTKDSFYVWNSAGKTLTAMAIGLAQQEGHLSINDPSNQYLGLGWTSLPPEKENLITIKHQLSMTSGLTHTGDHFCTLPECLVYASDAGTRWSYHNGPYTILDKVIENATGQNLNSYVNQKIRSKIGMNGMFLQIGYNNINVSNLRSFARFGLLLLNNGTWNGNSILSDNEYYSSMINSSQNFNPSYGYLTWLNGKSSYMLPSPDFQISINESALSSAPADLYAAMGKNGQILNIIPSKNMVVVRMGDADGNSLVPTQYNDTIWQKINDLYCENSIKTNYKEIESRISNPVDDYLVFFHEIQHFSFEIFDNSGKILLRGTSNHKIDVTKLASGSYFVRLDEQIPVKFLKK